MTDDRKVWSTWVPPVLWTNTYGWARTLIALAQIATLLASDIAHLWVPLAGRLGAPPYCYSLPQAYGFYCVVGELAWAKWLAVVLLAVVASGWMPRWTGMLHAYLSWSAFVNINLSDGGEQTAAVVTTILVPFTLGDPRRWHWSTAQARTSVPQRWVAFASYGLLRLQASLLYFDAFSSKMAVEEWANGTVLYYWLTHPTFGAPQWLSPVLRPIILHPVGLPMLTWSVLALEFALSAALFADARVRKVLLPLGLLFHGGIIVFHGITSFSVIMAGLLILYLAPLDRALIWPSWRWRPQALGRLGRLVGGIEHPLSSNVFDGR